MTMFGWMHRASRAQRGPAPGSATLARERLTVLLAHEARFGGRSDLLKILHENIVSMISSHAAVEPDQIRVRMHRGGTAATIAIEIELPA